MGDKLHKKEKRLKYSSSFSGGLNNKESFKKIVSRASIAETDDHFARAKAKCDQLQDQLDNLTTKKPKRKSHKKSSTTRMSEGNLDEQVPFISVRTQPKKLLQNTTRLRRIDAPSLPRNTSEITQNDQNIMRRYSKDHITQGAKVKGKISNNEMRPMRNIRRQARPDGDNVFDPRKKTKCKLSSGYNEQLEEQDNRGSFDEQREMQERMRMLKASKNGSTFRNVTPQEYAKGHTTKYELPPKHGPKLAGPPTSRKKILPSSHNVGVGDSSYNNSHHDHPVVEQLFNCKSSSIMKSTIHEDEISIPEVPERRRNENMIPDHHKKMSKTKVEGSNPTYLVKSNKSSRVSVKRRIKYRTRSYEMPTVASQMKQAGMRFYTGASHNNIPFVVSKSTAPSHNIGVNLQQVLNGFKSQLPVSGIPLTIAHHMGLRYMPAWKANENCVLKLESEINVINFGDKILPVVCGKYISFDRLLTMYRESNGVVPKFLKSISRPHYFYTSMYNLTSQRDDLESSSSKFYCSRSHEAKQSLAEYAALYHEYSQLEQKQRNGNLDYDSSRRLEELVKELMHREDLIRRIVQNHKPMSEPEQPVRIIQSSTAGDIYKHSTNRLGVS